MDLKTELVALAVRHLSDKTNLIRRPDPFTETLNAFFGIESYDQRLARDLVADAAKLAVTIQRTRTNLKFKKIIRKF